MECCNLLELLDYLRDMTPSHQRARIKAHLVECLNCHKSLRWLTLVQTTAAEDQSFDFPEEVIAAIVANFKELTATDRRTIRQYIAELIFDTGILPQLAYGRLTTEESAVRQALYRAEGYDIDLRFELSYKTNDEQLIGRVLPQHRDATKVVQLKVELFQDGSLISAKDTNVRGAFKFEKLILGTYDLKISIPDGEINLERVPTARAV